MKDMFTQRAREALEAAEKTAQQERHDHIGTEHLLYGCLVAGGEPAETLSSLGVTAEQIHSMISGLPRNAYFGNITLTPRAKRALEEATRLVMRLNIPYIDTLHILITVLADRYSTGARLARTLTQSDEPIEALKQMLRSPGQSRPQDSEKKSEDTKTPTLDQYGKDLTAKAMDFDPVIGREDEIERVIQILCRRTKNNPCLIGEPGVGKTAIAEGLARRIAEGNVPELLIGKRLFSLDLSSMVAGTKYRGEFEERIKKTIDEVAASKNVILFLDELHTIIGAGAADGAIDASNILKPSLARGELQLIGATTINEYRKYIEKDAALERRFQPVHVDEPSVDDTILILKGLRDKYEAHHGVVITDEAISAAATLSARYISDRFLPDKAIDLIDEASASAKLASYTPPAALKKIEEELKQLQTEKQAAIDSQEFEKAAELRDRERAAQKLLDAKTAEWKEGRTKNRPSITEENIASVISGWMKIPVNKICEDDAQRLRHLESELHRRVVGQEEAISAVSRAIRRGRVGLKDPKRPIGSFIFLGPTGVGKTELCKALAEAMFGSEDAMIRIDMSEYMEKHSVSKMIGSPPGYVGFDENGTLTDKIRSKPYSVVLFDEIEKAHPDVFNILLQILEDGFLTDSHGRRVNFRNTVIIMTSNLGAEKISKAKTVGFVTNENADVDFNQTKEAVMQELKKAFRPELINRLDEIIVFHRLTEEELHTITRIMLDNVLRRLEANEIHATVDDSAVMLLAKAGYDPVYGARPLRRAITAKLEDLLAEKMLSNEIREGDSITIYAEDDTIKIKSE